MEIQRKWLFYAEDENGDSRYLQDFYFVGSYNDACRYAETMADEWEEETNGLILKLTIESHGKIANKALDLTPNSGAGQL